MALISCPECSHEVSDQAAACPNCGFPLRSKAPPVTTPPAPDADTRIVQALLTQGKIAAVKLSRELHPGTDLAEAKRRVDALEANLPAASRPPTGGAGCLLLLAAFLALAAKALS